MPTITRYESRVEEVQMSRLDLDAKWNYVQQTDSPDTAAVEVRLCLSSQVLRPHVSGVPK